MNIAIIDADLIGKKDHSFPNLACMKISGYYKSQGDHVYLKTNYDNLSDFDMVFISKVFTDTSVDEKILNLPNVQYGGTGFYYADAPNLPYEIEHHMPDYHLYDDYILGRITKGESKNKFTYYTDYSIGFMTRGCIRQCSFCVNRNYKKAELHSRLSEFFDPYRPYICLLDDNVLACKDWKAVFDSLISSGKRFQFKQGCDERLLTDEKCDYIFKKSKWIGERIFAFDNIKDREIIEKNIQMIRRHYEGQIKFYCFCGYNHDCPDEYSDEFWANDIADLFERIKILMKYGCLPYVMRYKDYELSPYKGMYINISSWCNQPSFFKKKSFSEFCIARGMSPDGKKRYGGDYRRYLEDGGKKYASWNYHDEFKIAHSDIAKKYFDMKWNYS